MAAQPTPFTLAVPEAALADLKARLALTRLPETMPGEPWAYGTSAAYLAELVAHWQGGFDWRAAEAAQTARPDAR